MLSRRTFLIASSLATLGFRPRTPNYGWLGGIKKNTKGQRFLRGTGASRQVFLWKALEKATDAPLKPHDQGDATDCIGQAWALGVDILSAVQTTKYREVWKGKHSPEVIYAGSRVEIGESGDLPIGGSNGEWAADFVREYGSLLRGKYGEHDLTTYSVTRSESWGRTGVPDDLEPRLRPVRTTALITSWAQARDAISNGYPIPVCSHQGFEHKRDSKGFAKPKGRWAHCMLLAGIDDDPVRPGGLIINSWGDDWITGPKRHGQPEGSFWVDADTLDEMLGSNTDSFAMSQFFGFPAQNLDYRLW